MRATYLLAGVLFGVMAAMAVPVVAEVDMPPGAVVHGDRAMAKIGDDGATTVTPLVEGRWAYLGEMALGAGTTVETHTQDKEEYLYVLHGTAVLTIDGEQFFVGPRRGVYLPVGAEVRWVAGSDGLVAVQMLAGRAAGDQYDDWSADEQQRPHWPYPSTGADSPAAGR